MEGTSSQMPEGLRSKRAGGQRGKNAKSRGAKGQGVHRDRDVRSEDAKGRDGKRQRCEGGRKAKGRDVNERGAKGEVKREGYKGEGCKGRLVKRRNAKGRGGQDRECKEATYSRAEKTHPGARAAAAGYPLEPGWALAASRALEGERLAHRALEVRGGQGAMHSSCWERGA